MIMNKQIKALAFGFDDSDTQVLREQFAGGSGIFLVDSLPDVADAAGVRRVLDAFKATLPDMVLASLIREPEHKMSAIREICSITDELRPPYFITAQYTDETDLKDDLYAALLMKLGDHFHRYGKTQDIMEIVSHANMMVDFVHDKREREARGVYWKCDTSAP